MSTTTEIPRCATGPRGAALKQHHGGDPPLRHLRELFADDPEPRRAADRPRARACSWTTPRTASPTRRCGCCSRWPRSPGWRERIDAMFRGEQINVTENRAVLHVALRAPRGEHIDGRRRGRRAGGPRGARPHGRVRRRRCAPATWQGHTGKPIRNVVNIGIGGSDLGPVMAYEALRHYSRPRPDLPLRLQRRRHRLRRGHPRPRPGRDAVHRLLQDVHHAGDDDQRAHRRASGRWPRSGDEQAVAKHFVAVSTNAEKVVGVRHRHRQHVRLLGLGRRPLLDGLGDRPVDDARRRARTASARCWPASTRWTSTSAPRRSSAEPAGADGPAGRLVRRLLRRPDAWRCCPTSSTSSASRPTCSS